MIYKRMYAHYAALAACAEQPNLFARTEIEYFAMTGDLAALYEIREKREFCGAELTMILEGGAVRGHKNICKYSRDQGADDFKGMLAAGIAGGREHICTAAVEWGAKWCGALARMAAALDRYTICLQLFGRRRFLQQLCEGTAESSNVKLFYIISRNRSAARLDYARILSIAAEYGNHGACRIIIESKKLDKSTLGKALMVSAKYGRWPICRHLLECGAGQINEAACIAAYYGHWHVTVLMHKTGKIDVEDVLAATASAGRVDLCGEARRAGARDYDRMLVCGALAGYIEVCELASEWGATNFDDMLSAAASASNPTMYVAARSRGATDFDRARRTIDAGGDTRMQEYARIIESLDGRR